MKNRKSTALRRHFLRQELKQVMLPVYVKFAKLTQQVSASAPYAVAKEDHDKLAELGAIYPQLRYLAYGEAAEVVQFHLRISTEFAKPKLSALEVREVRESAKAALLGVKAPLS